MWIVAGRKPLNNRDAYTCKSKQSPLTAYKFLPEGKDFTFEMRLIPVMKDRYLSENYQFKERKGYEEKKKTRQRSITSLRWKNSYFIKFVGAYGLWYCRKKKLGRSKFITSTTQRKISIISYYYLLSVLVLYSVIQYLICMLSALALKKLTSVYCIFLFSHEKFQQQNFLRFLGLSSMLTIQSSVGIVKEHLM